MLFDLICVGKWAKLVFMPMQTNFFPKRSLAAGRSFCRRDLLPTSQCLVLGWRSSWGYTAQHDAIGARWGCGLIIFPRQRKDHLDPFGWLITVVSATKIHKHTHTGLSVCMPILALGFRRGKSQHWHWHQLELASSICVGPTIL